VRYGIIGFIFELTLILILELIMPPKRKSQADASAPSKKIRCACPCGKQVTKRTQSKHLDGVSLLTHLRASALPTAATHDPLIPPPQFHGPMATPHAQPSQASGISNVPAMPEIFSPTPEEYEHEPDDPIEDPPHHPADPRAASVSDYESDDEGESNADEEDDDEGGEWDEFMDGLDEEFEAELDQFGV
jgi:hypothetical protein